MNKYENAVGVEGQLITGKAPSASTDTFRSQAELVAAMGDPRYDNDPAYRQDVISKLDRSKINFLIMPRGKGTYGTKKGRPPKK